MKWLEHVIMRKNKNEEIWAHLIAKMILQALKELAEQLKNHTGNKAAL
ncbi:MULTISPECIES: hypothetical protein [Aeribacillus]|nr:hypothetical protein [Aeribacillus composti]